jgi:hypothetical protein
MEERRLSSGSKLQKKGNEASAPITTNAPVLVALGDDLNDVTLLE